MLMRFADRLKNLQGDIQKKKKKKKKKEKNRCKQKDKEGNIWLL